MEELEAVGAGAWHQCGSRLVFAIGRDDARLLILGREMASLLD